MLGQDKKQKRNVVSGKKEKCSQVVGWRMVRKDLGKNYFDAWKAESVHWIYLYIQKTASVLTLWLLSTNIWVLHDILHYPIPPYTTLHYPSSPIQFFFRLWNACWVVEFNPMRDTIATFRQFHLLTSAASHGLPRSIFGFSRSMLWILLLFLDWINPFLNMSHNFVFWSTHGFYTPLLVPILHPCREYTLPAAKQCGWWTGINCQ